MPAFSSSQKSCYSTTITITITKRQCHLYHKGQLPKYFSFHSIYIQFVCLCWVKIAGANRGMVIGPCLM